jgi:hypothetical protein
MEITRTTISEREFNQALQEVRATPGFVKAHVESLVVEAANGTRYVLSGCTFLPPKVVAHEAPQRAIEG